MIELGEFNTLIVDEPHQLIRLGPAPSAEWIEVGGWGTQEWDALVAIVSRAGGYPEGQIVFDNRRVAVNRKVVFRIRERLRRALGRALGDRVIVTNRNTSATFLNPAIKARFFPPVRRDRASALKIPRAFDSMLDAIMRAGYEIFGAPSIARAIDLLPDDARWNTVEQRNGPGRWVPVHYITSWMRAIASGPAAQSRDAYEHFVRRVELYRMSPRFLDYLRCQDARLVDIGRMWSYCYDSGDFEATLSPKNETLELRLWNHPYCHELRTANIFALCWRFLAEHLHAKEPRVEACAVEGLTGALRIVIAGDFR